MSEECALPGIPFLSLAYSLGLSTLTPTLDFG